MIINFEIKIVLNLFVELHRERPGPGSTQSSMAHSSGLSMEFKGKKRLSLFDLILCCARKKKHPTILYAIFV
jgi:hypothetical protein